MRRRDAVKALAITTVTPKVFFNGTASAKDSAAKAVLRGVKASFESKWQNWPDMLWVGPDYWGNRLQDWEIQSGRVVCNVSGKNRALHNLCCQLNGQKGAFNSSVILEIQNVPEQAKGYAGLRLGAKGPFEDYRSAAVFGKGLDVGINREGQLFIGETTGEGVPAVNRPILLNLKATPQGKTYSLTLSATAQEQGEAAELTVSDISAEILQGNIALVSHFEAEGEAASQPSAIFDQWNIEGEKIDHQPEQSFGPVCFAQYTLQNKTLKLTAQLTPIESIEDYKVSLQVQEKGQWKTIQQRSIDPMGRTAQFRIESWPYEEGMPYRVKLDLPLVNETATYFYEGTIAKEPTADDQVKMAVFSCNADHGFPDQEVAVNVEKHQPHLAVFLGDQYYEGSGGFGIQKDPVEKAALDFLHKWYMFGWSYRDIFKDIPSACIPDDHDVYHGNVWGEGGKHAPSDEGWGYVAQDQGGYKMPVTWVNMVQRTQTGHLPDPYDPTPVKRGIGVYYTGWNYGGVSMAILEDRKFKSAPKNVLPEEARVTNGFIQNREFDIKKHRDIDAELLGERQLRFLEDWGNDWSHGAQMKAVLSQTNFCTVATLPEGSIIDSIVPSLPTPEKGEYVKGDAPTTDMDSNGWPQEGRDKAVRALRKCFALHIAGDQHLASTVRYGVDEFGDAGFAFAGPALNNLWPRRWWPTIGEGHQPLEGQPPYTGNFLDGFGNRMTVHAVANPYQSGREPARIYDRGTGYGMITFDKQAREMKIECWPRYVDPIANPEGQYDGWPITVSQKENYGRKAVAYLDEIEIQGTADPVVEVINEASQETEYVLRIKGNRIQPYVFAEGSYTLKVSAPEEGKMKSLKGLKTHAKQSDGGTKQIQL
ncbi:alkaline phosphatase D [Catalinimonas alkaloidigena]|uniref:alkaline phosphatase D family protein n=1 Tax=Catalinimonas alkaloidigena TaxID=1075417 RepID=UPI0024056BC5|nr:alkaline phosphatase D family protein [Catalinimonas alkaloidigena]MDF9795074.1 alkaline phosphatase D [Catalinimonas alkaloidigena]